MTAGRLLPVVFCLSCVASLNACSRASADAPSPFAARDAFTLGVCTRCGVVESIVTRPVYMEQRRVYSVTIRLDHGGRRLLTFQEQPRLRVGDAVRLEGDVLERT